jgi:hypothetical protein
MKRCTGEYTMTRAIIGPRATPWRDAEPPVGRDHHRGPSRIHRLCVAVRGQRFLHRQVDDAEENQERHPSLERPYTFAARNANHYVLNVVACPRPLLKEALRHRQDLLVGREERAGKCRRKYRRNHQRKEQGPNSTPVFRTRHSVGL